MSFMKVFFGDGATGTGNHSTKNTIIAKLGDALLTAQQSYIDSVGRNNQLFNLSKSSNTTV